MNYSALCYSTGYSVGDTSGSGFHPVVTLDDSIEITGGDGTKASPWTIEKIE